MPQYSLVPTNLAQEKRKFFFDPLYNPQFTYEQAIPETYLYKYGAFGGELSEKAKAIIDAVIKRWGSESAYLEEIEGKILARDESTAVIKQYLKDCELTDMVTLHFSSNFIPRTHIEGYKMNIRLPVEYREHGIMGMLDHEIGTHVYRRLNDEKQVWHDHREQYELENYMETEEGLAVLNYYLDSKEPYFWIYALQYYACFLASQMSFSQVFSELKPYVDDKERRFKITLRAKRGQTDTSIPGGYTKDQVYLRGVIKVWNWLLEHDFNVQDLYIGKVGLGDVERLLPLAVRAKERYPRFLQDKVAYKKKIMRIMKLNKLDN